MTDAQDDFKPLVGKLVTKRGEALLTVPPQEEWTSKARYALTENGGGSDYLWAKLTLSAKDFAEWDRLDPNVTESVAFFGSVGIDAGESEASQD